MSATEALKRFELIVRRAHQLTDQSEPRLSETHPFEQRDIHPALPRIVRTLFDDSHYAQATFEAFKYLDKEVQRLARSSKTGFALMMEAFAEQKPRIALTPRASTSDRDEQGGYKYIFAGSILAIRNPRGHEHSLEDDIDLCLDHLSLVSLLLRRLEQAAYTLSLRT